jgi:hypothetical protein
VAPYSILNQLKDGLCYSLYINTSIRHEFPGKLKSYPFIATLIPFWVMSPALKLNAILGVESAGNMSGGDVIHRGSRMMGEYDHRVFTVKSQLTFLTQTP